MPLALQERPQLLPDLAFYWSAFWDLSSTRVVTSAGIQPISFQEMKAYLELREVGTPLVEDLIRCVKVLDIEFLRYTAEEQRKKLDKKS